MASRELAWERGEHAVTDEDMAVVEQALGVRFPEAYRSVVLKWNGGTPTPRSFRVRVADREFGSVVGAMLSLSAQDSGNLLEVCGWLDDRPKHLVPFADDGGGDFVCFDFSAGADPAVVYWHRTGLPAYEFARLAGSFEEFLDRLG